MKKIINTIFSMEVMGLLILLFAFAVGTATFIENDYGAIGAKVAVYNSKWFEALLILLCINLVVNIFRYKMYRLEKLAVFSFHVSFIVILIGAGITRYIGYEGVMSIREGATGTTMLSDKTHVVAELIDNQNVKVTDKAVMMSAFSETSYHDSESINGKKFSFKSLRYIPNAQEVITEGAPGQGVPYVTLVVSSGNSGRQNIMLKDGESKRFAGYMINFNRKFDSTAINIKMENGSLLVQSPYVLTTMAMADASKDTIDPFKIVPFQMMKLHSFGELKIVLTDLKQNGVIDYQSYEGKDSQFMDAIVVKVESGNETKEVTLRGGDGYQGEPESFEMNGVKVNMTYGAKIINLPFGIKLNDFELERYPGSMSPASYASQVTLIDKQNGVEMPYRIFMNNVLNYKGYRFFQSSFDKDEKGTVLSVNKDGAGTFVTYLGYLIMTIAMMLALFVKNTRFALLGKMLKSSTTTAKVILVGILLSTSTLMAQNTDMVGVDKDHAAKFGRMLVQDQDGRLKPMNTVASELLRKISRKSSFNGLNPEQVYIGMLLDPQKWQRLPMIKVKHPELKQFLGINGDRAAFTDVLDFSKGGNYKLRDLVSQAYQKKASERSKFDQDVIAVDERVNIFYMAVTGELMKILPNPAGAREPWLKPGDEIRGLSKSDSSFISSVLTVYLQSLAGHDMKQADMLLQGIIDYQKKFGKEIIQSDSNISAEITYNKLMIFDRLSNYFGLVGIIMLVFVFMNIFKERKWINKSIGIFYIIIIVFFAMQTLGLGLRWYISGRAPWSNGYESMIYISWVTVLAGLIFSRKSPMTIAATSILASIILMVAHLSWMDPEITNLVPVLKSYWLTIHVSVITASYGFLALGALLGFINLLLMILKTPKNFEHLGRKIKELNFINERTIIIGLYLLTIGTFLGGVWANESWGRYWGWDPKETWALVTVLIYSFVAHMGYVPGLKTDYSFSLVSLVAYSSVIMTYFGVNYYLSGLHSYAKGDPVPVPTFVYYTVAVIFIVAVGAFINERRLTKISK
ncbi:MAG: cytochrome c biogenesis protein CcsA [Bacteroidales bacterium]|nr:cytochrome c biogenesis protein CcsA [Bacteroidales bacterium]